MKLTFRPGYAIATVLVFLIEVLIALYVRDSFVRPYGGDILAVVFVYLGFRAITTMGVGTAAFAAFGVAFLVEIAQALNIITLIGLADNQIARVVLGTSFAWGDIAAYLAGFALILMGERIRSTLLRPRPNAQN